MSQTGQDEIEVPHHGRSAGLEVHQRHRLNGLMNLAIGMRFKSGEVHISADDIKRFAAEFGPQPMHLHERAAAKTLFKPGGIRMAHGEIAMNLAIQTRPFGPHPLIGMSVEGLRWLMPVRPDDVLHFRRPDRQPHSIEDKAARCARPLPIPTNSVTKSAGPASLLGGVWMTNRIAGALLRAADRWQSKELSMRIVAIALAGDAKHRGAPARFPVPGPFL